MTRILFNKVVFIKNKQQKNVRNYVMRYFYIIIIKSQVYKINLSCVETKAKYCKMTNEVKYWMICDWDTETKFD